MTRATREKLLEIEDQASQTLIKLTILRTAEKDDPAFNSIMQSAIDCSDATIRRLREQLMKQVALNEDLTNKLSRL